MNSKHIQNTGLIFNTLLGLVHLLYSLYTVQTKMYMKLYICVHNNDHHISLNLNRHGSNVAKINGKGRNTRRGVPKTSSTSPLPLQNQWTYQTDF